MSVTSSCGSSFPSGVSNANDSFSLPHIEGYDYEFDPPLDRKYECPICLSTLREPRQTNCGHRFCRDCILRWLRDSGKRCPVDNETLSESEIFPDNFAKREILNCSVKCPNHKDGCNSVVVLYHIRAHLDECPLSLKPCPYNCTSILPQRELVAHMEKFCQHRTVSCPLCQSNLKANEFPDHAIVCPKAPVQCQYCNMEIWRDEMETHVREKCDKVIVPCPFHFLGCKIMNERSQEDAHLAAEVPSHMKQISHIMGSLLHQLGNVASSFSQNGVKHQELSRTFAQLKINRQSPSEMCSVPNPSEPTPTLGPAHHHWSHPLGHTQKHVGERHMGGTLQASLSDYNRLAQLPYSFPCAGGKRWSYDMADRRNGQASVASTPQPSFQNSDNPFFGRISPMPSSMHRNESVSAMSDCSPNPQIPFNGNHLPSSSTSSSDAKNIGASLSEQSKAEGNIHAFVNVLQEVCLRQREDLVCQQQLIEHMYHQLCQVQKSNQELVSQVKELESQSFHFDTRSHCGDFYWHILDYRDLRKRASSGETTILHSKPFSTSPWGYKLCIRANISGFVNNNHEHYLSLFIHFMQGSNDALLRWPFKGQIILSVIDQNEVYSERQHIVETLESKSQLEAFKQPTSARNHKGFGFTEFVTLTTLERGTFIRNDCVVVRAQVFPEN